MREIKFRAWSPQMKVMFYFGLFDEKTFATDSLIMQFTGLLDKNGKEIYEGDVLKFNRYWRDHFGKEFSEVFFLDGEFKFSHNLVNEYRLSVICSESEIIGNIYENPELLGEPKE